LLPSPTLFLRNPSGLGLCLPTTSFLRYASGLLSRATSLSILFRTTASFFFSRKTSGFFGGSTLGFFLGGLARGFFGSPSGGLFLGGFSGSFFLGTAIQLLLCTASGIGRGSPEPPVKIRR
jgi:hypothetical protein